MTEWNEVLFWLAILGLLVMPHRGGVKVAPKPKGPRPRGIPWPPR